MPIDWTKFETWKDAASTAQSVVTILALIIGGVWTYTLFIKQRTDKPRLRSTLNLQVAPFRNHQRLLVVDLSVLNAGNTLIELDQGMIAIKQVVPVPAEADAYTQEPIAIHPQSDGVHFKSGLTDSTPLDGKLQLEPGEMEQIHTELIIPCSVQVAEISSFLTNKSLGGTGWRTFASFDFTQHPVSSCPEMAKR
jgi:hypothetical protein